MVRLISVSSCFGSELVGYYEEEVEKRQRDLGCFAPTVSGNFPGYSKKDLARIASQNESMRVAEIRLARQTSFSLNVLESLKKEKPSLLSTGMEAPSSHLVREFRDQTIIGLRQDAKYAQRYGRAEEYRLFVTEKVAELRAIAQIVDRLEAKAKEWDLPLNMPEIRPAAEHVVSFDRLVPIHLIGRQVGEKILRPRDLVPVTMPHPLNGRMIGLTGQNAGGKTVIEETIITNIFLAQSGLPVFGERLLLNPKNALGLVFLERGEGSTLELMLKKTRSVLEAVQASTENGIVVFLDEVGTGTQEEGGLAIGERILRKLSQHGCSVMFSTQITALAEKAKRDMNALCCQVDLGHSIQPGIGTGGAEILARKLGIDQLLQ